MTGKRELRAKASPLENCPTALRNEKVGCSIHLSGTIISPGTQRQCWVSGDPEGASVVGLEVVLPMRLSLGPLLVTIKYAYARGKTAGVRRHRHAGQAHVNRLKEPLASAAQRSFFALRQKLRRSAQ
jgi:hypothetical protein